LPAGGNPDRFDVSIPDVASGVESWCAMKSLIGPAAVMALGGTLLFAPSAVADGLPDAAQATSTQVVNFSVDGSFCPQYGLYGIAHVTVDGTAGMTADQNFIWTTTTAATSIHSVPPAGAVANVTVVYHCNVQVLWWVEPGSARRVSAALWVNGSGPQPSYTIRPGQAAPQPTLPPTSQPPAPPISQSPTPTSLTAPQPTSLPTSQPPAPPTSQPPAPSISQSPTPTSLTAPQPTSLPTSQPTSPPTAGPTP
jgi:hypothetical protein